MQTKEIRLGGEVFTLSELPLKANADWRKLFESKLEPLLGLLGGLNDLKVNNAQDLSNIIDALRKVLLQAPDILVELVFAYAPNLVERREWIENYVYESELLEAVTEVLQLAYPFGALFDLAKKINGAAGAPGAQTSRNLPSRNGQAPKVGRTKARK